MERKEYETKLFLRHGRQFKLQTQEDNINVWRVHEFIYYPNVVLDSTKRTLRGIPYLLVYSDWSYSNMQKKLNRDIVKSILVNLGEQTYERINYRFYDNIFVTKNTVIVYANDKCFLKGRKNKFYKLMMRSLEQDYPKGKYVYLLINNNDYELKLKLV